MPHEIVREDHVSYARPRSVAAAVARGQNDRISELPGRPDVFENVALERDPFTVLHLENVLDRPLGAGCGGLPGSFAAARIRKGGHGAGRLEVHVFTGGSGAAVDAVAVGARNRRPAEGHFAAGCYGGADFRRRARRGRVIW